MTKEDLTENIFVNIGNGYYHFTTSEKKVADYVLSNKIDVQYMSISELANECGVAEATITRFCRHLRLSGYNGFKLALAKAEAQVESTKKLDIEESDDVTIKDSISELEYKIYQTHMAALNQSLTLTNPENIERAVDILWRAERVYCMGQGGSMFMAMEAAHLFSTIAPHFYAVQDSHLQASAAATLTEKDALLFFSYSGSTKEIVELMELARMRGAATVLVTRYLRSPGAAKSDIVLQCGANEGPLQLGSVPARMAQLFVLDVLYHEFIRRDPEQARTWQERIAEALSERHL